MQVNLMHKKQSNYVSLDLKEDWDHTVEFINSKIRCLIFISDWQSLRF